MNFLMCTYVEVMFDSIGAHNKINVEVTGPRHSEYGRGLRAGAKGYDAA